MFTPSARLSAGSITRATVNGWPGQPLHTPNSRITMRASVASSSSMRPPSASTSGRMYCSIAAAAWSRTVSTVTRIVFSVTRRASSRRPRRCTKQRGRSAELRGGLLAFRRSPTRRSEQALRRKRSDLAEFLEQAPLGFRGLVDDRLCVDQLATELAEQVGCSAERAHAAALIDEQHVVTGLVCEVGLAVEQLALDLAAAVTRRDHHDRCCWGVVLALL